jgi:enamine deaminase RidA (YjgF/YER057c/UK114 family)
LNNVINLLKDANFTPNEVAELRVYLTDIKEEQAFNAMVGKFFVAGYVPALTIIGVASLPGEVAVAMDAVAIKPSADQVS